jgi:hypothetical protein
MKPSVRRANVLFPVAFVLLFLGAHPLAVACNVLIVAPFQLEGEKKKAAFAVLWAAVSALLLTSSFVVALAHGAGAAMGIVLARAIERRWTYGWQLTLAAGSGFAAMGGLMLVTWDALRHDTTIFFNARIAELEAQQNVNTQWIEMFRWWDLHYESVALGSAFSSILILTALTLCLLERWQRDPETRARRKPTGFQQMRVPDWVVWIAITAALMWFADGRWPNAILRVVAWNTALGLLSLYWLNGVSILLYSLTVFKATAFGMFMVFSGILLFGLWPMLGIFGLFDTWYDFRMRIRRIAMLRRVSYRPDDQDF